MIPVFIGSVSPYSGKSTVCLGLSLKFRDEGFSTGYFKPVGVLPTSEGGVVTDEDVEFFRASLMLTEPVQHLCPVLLTRDTLQKAFKGELENVRDRILSSFNIVAKDKDIMLIVGVGDLHSGKFLGYSELDFINDVGARVILTGEYDRIGQAVDACLHAAERLGDKLIGVVFNRASATTSEYIKETVAPFMSEKGVQVLGVIQRDPVLGAVPVSELVEALNAKLLCCEDAVDELVERFSVGAMNLDSALKFFRVQFNKGVIVGGDRADIQLAALETSTKCLILTGDLYPNEIILAKAEEKGIPVMVVKTDTLTTVETCEKLLGHLSLHSPKKIQRAAEVVSRSLDIAHLKQKLGL